MMVCQRLNKGGCNITKKKCNKKYEIKMVKYKDCSVYKKGKVAAKPKTKSRRRQ